MSDKVALVEAAIVDALDDLFDMNDPADGYYANDEAIHALAVTIVEALR